MNESYTDSPEVFANAAVGQVRMIAQADPIPDGWRECDGARLPSAQWPEFVEWLAVQGATFTVPQPERVLDGRRFIVKMGRELLFPDHRREKVSERSGPGPRNREARAGVRDQGFRPALLARLHAGLKSVESALKEES